MFISLNDFVSEWNREAEMTQKVLGQLKDEAMQQRIAEGFHSLGELAWHLAGSMHAFLSSIGLQFQAPGEQSGSASAVQNVYAEQSRLMLEAVQSQWQDATLSETRDLFGMMPMPVQAALRLLIQHQAHHRGQMTVLMRQAGLVVPGVYGPSKEEYAAMMKG